MTLTPEADSVLFREPVAPSALRRIGRLALNILFPAHCAACHAPVEPPTNTVLCRACAERVKWIGADRCRRCGDRAGAGSGAVSDCPSCRSYPPAYIESACSIGKFEEGPLRDLVLTLKFGRKSHIAKPLGQLIAARIRATNLVEATETLLLVPVPLTKAHLQDSGWNHAEEIANCAAEELKARVEPKLLKKIRSTPPQATLKRMERRKNLKDAFECDPARAKKYSGATIVLIDDVITTGTTISECARTLHAAGFQNIRAASVARA